MDSLKIDSIKQESFLFGVIHSAGFLLEEFEGTEEAEDYAKCLIGEAVKDWGLKYVQEVLEQAVWPIEKTLRIKKILDQIK